MKFQELLFDDQDEIQVDDKLSQILSELDLMVGSEIDEFGWFLTDYFDDPEEFSNNIEVFTKDDIIRMLNTLAKDENSDEIFSDILHGLEFVEVDELEESEEIEDKLDEPEIPKLNLKFKNNKIYVDDYCICELHNYEKDNEYKLAFKDHKIYHNGNVIFDVDDYIQITDVQRIADDFNRYAREMKWGSNVVFVKDHNHIEIDGEFFDYYDGYSYFNAILSEKEFKDRAKYRLLTRIDYIFFDEEMDDIDEVQDIIDVFTNLDLELNEVYESEHTDLNFENNKIYLNNKLIFDIDTYVENTDIETIANDFNSFAISNKWGSGVAEVTDDGTVVIDYEWFGADADEVTENEFREYAKQSLISILDNIFSDLDTLEENLQNYIDCFVHGIVLNETPSINPANKSTQKAKFRKRINRAWNAHSKSYNKAHAVKNRVERIASGTARKQKRYGKVYKRRLSLARKNRSNLTKRKARFSRIRPKSGFGTNQAKQNLRR